MRKIIVVLVAILLFGCNSKEKAEYNYDLGITKFNSKEYSLAKEEFSKAIDIYSKYSEAYKERGASKFMLFDYQGAKEDYSKAIDINSDYIIAYIKRGDVKIFLDDYQGAIEDYSRAIELSKNEKNRSFDLSIAFNKRGVAKSYLSDHIGEREDYNNAIEAYSENSDAYSNMASSIVLNGEIKEEDWIIPSPEILQNAIDYYLKAIDIDPENANVLYNCYIITYLLDAPDRKWENRANKFNPNYEYEGEDEFNFIDLRSSRSLFGLVLPKYIINHYALIGDATNKIIKNNNDYEAFESRAKSKEELKDYYGSIADYQKSFEIAPLVEHDAHKRVNSYKNMLELITHIQQYDDAISGYTKLFEIKNDYSVLEDRGKVKSILKDYEGAINDYNQAINVDPNSTSVLLCYSDRGDAKGALKDYKGAISDYTKAISIIKNDIPTDVDDYTISYDFLLDGFYFARGVSYYYNKNFLEAINDYNSVLGMRIDKTTALRTFANRGHAKLELDDISGACKDFNIVKNLLKEDGDDYSNIQKLIDSNCSQ